VIINTEEWVVRDKEYWERVERDTDTELIWGENDTY
jgi:hypothetical protein